MYLLSARSLVLLLVTLWAGAALPTTLDQMRDLQLRGRRLAEGRPDPSHTITGCTVLRWEREVWDRPSIFIDKPGKYCIDRDYTADMRGCFHGGCHAYFIQISSNDVEVDLRGHTLRVIPRADGLGYGGVLALGDRIAVRNGKLINTGLLFRAAGAPSETDFETKGAPSQFGGYSEGQATVEDIVVQNAFEPLLILGKNAVVRRNRFVSGPFTAPMQSGPIVEKQILRSQPKFVIGIYGPAPVLEANVIDQRTRTAGRAVVHSIVLRGADNAVVQNNVVRNRGDSKSTVAVGLKDSQNVTIEGNVLENIERPTSAIND